MAIVVSELPISGLKIVNSKKFGDHRGFFSETYNRQEFAKAGMELDFVQDNHSLSGEKGTIRGLHFQIPPFSQDKLVRVTRGRILDVALDLRRTSSTFGQWAAVEISASEWNQILVPVGFAHGFCTLEPDTEVIYKVTNYYSPAHELGVLWDDPDLAITWPIKAGEAVLSDKDRKLPRLKDLAYRFD